MNKWNPIKQNFWDSAKAVLSKRKFINGFIKKKKKKKPSKRKYLYSRRNEERKNNLRVHLQRKEIINICAEIGEIETRT